MTRIRVLFKLNLLRRCIDSWTSARDVLFHDAACELLNIFISILCNTMSMGNAMLHMRCYTCYWCAS